MIIPDAVVFVPWFGLTSFDFLTCLVVIVIFILGIQAKPPKPEKSTPNLSEI
jgi:hypothetical protein